MKTLLKFLCLTIVLLPGSRTILIAQTTLSRGELVIIEFNGNGTDGFTFMPFVNLTAGTTINFIDYRWDGAAFFIAEDGTNIPPGGHGNMIAYIASSAITSCTLIRQNSSDIVGSTFTATQWLGLIKSQTGA